jgi:toxin ParE1/3/4
MSEPRFSPSSQRDLREILEYIARDKPGAALRYIDKLEETCWFLADNPEAGTLRDDLLPNLRSWPHGSHIIFYRPSSDGVDIVRVVHGTRDCGRLFT